MIKNEILAMLRDLGNEKRKQMVIKNGAGENTYGVLLGELRKLANQLGTNHELALELWQSGNTDAQWLACMLFDAKKLTSDEIQSMVSQLTYADMIDKFIGAVVRNHKDADSLAEEWSASGKDNLGRAGWDLIVYKVSSGKLTNDALEELLTRIEAQLQTATPGKQWAMNHALCEIGIGYPQFTERCIALGETLGVYRDLKVAKGCTSAYAPNWIAAGVKKRKK
ncbi:MULTISPECIES: DNA alkylation repair protein [Desulfitobacterium]|uniref:Putative DNA alkylation repair enzyme n=1 Tax=Desulfitobacterium dehalogenans (strain ATCC 51507 / DSM 9161 / JW/IU-DC1) TaxID=756499 RepID=I4A7R3_DESDJ|nr:MULTISPECIES: DNA alkylation repair protein [Desulfitobacterium]AFL99997.1 putative DNA alkylation repair enzyme [Desulfitobacterium dehalogenans ATCC 51507]